MVLHALHRFERSHFFRSKMRANQQEILMFSESAANRPEITANFEGPPSAA